MDKYSLNKYLNTIKELGEAVCNSYTINNINGHACSNHRTCGMRRVSAEIEDWKEKERMKDEI